MKKLLNKIRNNQGDETIDTALILAIILPIFICLIVGGWSFFQAQAKTNDVNFLAGRYLSTHGCSSKVGSSMYNHSTFAGYDIIVSTPEYTPPAPDGDYGTIYVFCPTDANKGSTFKVVTKTNVSSFGTFFPKTTQTSGYFTQEVYQSE